MALEVVVGEADQTLGDRLAASHPGVRRLPLLPAMEELLHESEGGRQIQSQWRSFLMIEPPSYPTPIRVHGGLGP